MFHLPRHVAVNFCLLRFRFPQKSGSWQLARGDEQSCPRTKWCWNNVDKTLWKLQKFGFIQCIAALTSNQNLFRNAVHVLVAAHVCGIQPIHQQMYNSQNLNVFNHIFLNKRNPTNSPALFALLHLRTAKFQPTNSHRINQITHTYNMYWGVQVKVYEAQWLKIKQSCFAGFGASIIYSTNQTAGHQLTCIVLVFLCTYL